MYTSSHQLLSQGSLTFNKGQINIQKKKCLKTTSRNHRTLVTRAAKMRALTFLGTFRDDAVNFVGV